MFENAKEYLARVVPWPLPGEPGFVNLHWTFPPTTPRPDGKPAWTGRAVTSAGEAAKALEFALKNGSNTLDVYACMSSQLAAKEQTTKGKRPFTYYAPIRLASNAMMLKSFFIDVDFGKASGNSYATAEEALVNLMAFIAKVGLPKPTMIVHSGGGFHVYWCVSRALTPDEWLPIAFALAEATKAHGLKCDTQCTVDSVRVLRIPDTFNRKQEPARHVRFIGPRLDFDYSLDRIATPLLPYAGKHTPTATGPAVDRSLFPPRTVPAFVSELAASLDDLYPDSDLDLVLTSCGFLADAVATGGANLNNPLFNLVNLICTFTKGGRADAHRMAKGHANYDPNSTYTDEFFDRKDRERRERGLGWPSCATISATGSTACKGCPQLALGKSPLNFEQRPAPTAFTGTAAIAQQAAQGVAAHAVIATTAGGFGTAQTSPTGPAQLSSSSSGSSQNQSTGLLGPVTSQGNDLPSGYLRDANGIVSRVMVDPNNPSLQISHPISKYPMLNAWIQSDPMTLHFDSQVEIGRVAQVDIEFEAIGGMEMRKVLQRQGFMLIQNDKHSGEFFVSWVQKLQAMKASVASAPFGWQDKNGQTEGFIFGGQLWTPNGNSPSATANPVINQQYKPKGSDAYWMDAVQLVTSQGRPDLEAIVASAFAAPLVMFTGHLGMLMSAYSKESGIGKSTALRIAQAVWGDPIRAVQSLSDTQNSVMKKIGEVRSLPIYWDELKTDEDTKKFVNMTFQIAQGKEKSRLNQHAQMKEPGHWQTLVVSASNDSLIDHVTQQTQTTLAGLYRIFEYTVVPSLTPSGVDTSEATIRLSKLNTNHGAVGLKYAAWLGANFPQIEKDMALISKELNIETASVQEERFWISLIACILLGARYANMLGYSVLDEGALKSFMLNSLDTMRKLRGLQTVDLTRTINVSSIMASFLKEMQKENKIIRTNRIHIAAGRPPAQNSPNAVKLLLPNDPSRLNGIVVQIGQTDKLMRISSTAFGEWLKKSGKSRHLLMEALQASITMTHVVGFLGGGTGLAFAKENIIQIDLSSSNELNFVDEIQ
jgi:hypothetical protein